MKNLLICMTLFAFIIAVSHPVNAASPEDSVKEGNRLYDQGEYDEAVQKYREAKEQSPDSDIAGFNLGAALFKKGDYKESIDAFTQSLNTENPELEADATYNIANAKYQLGSELLTSDLNGAATLYRESLDYYKRSIELNESNSDARYNHELVEKELKVLLEQIKNQPEQQQKDEQEKEQDQKEGDQEKQQSQEQSEEDKDGQEKQEQDDKQQSGDDPEQEQDGTDKQMGDQGEDQKEVSGQMEEDTGEMSPEEAKMLLDAFADEEAMDNLKKKRQRYNADVLKDW